MRTWPRHLVGMIGAALGMFVALATAGAQTCTLELKRLESPTGSRADYIYRSTYPQGFHMQVGRGRPDPQAAGFTEIVKKEPAKYESEQPFRGVAELGTEKYAFVLDSRAPEADATPPESDSAEAKSEEPEADSAGPKKPPEPPKPLEYSRLYFDLNHNGDLTDDKVIEAEQPRGRFPTGYSQRQFPRVDLTIEADGTKMEYAFFFSVYSNTSTYTRSEGGQTRTETFRYASAQLNAAVYREGEITLDGKPTRVVLLDFNSNGRFDDQFKIREDVRTADGQVYPMYGDMLLVDPDPSASAYRSPYDPTTSDYQHHLSKLVNIDGRYYDLEISAAGDKLTLTPSSLPVGYVTNPNEGLRAVVYGDKGFLKVSGGKSQRVPLPEGDWKLLSYTIDRTGYQEPADQSGEGKEGKQERSLLQVLTEALIGDASSRVPGRSGPTLVSARGTRGGKAVEVREGQTVAITLGPPYKPVVKVSSPLRPGQQVPLELSLVGSAGEVCTNLYVDGKRPEKPEFTISTAEGEEVERGTFEYG